MTRPELDLAALGRALPDHQPTDERREAVRTAILLEAEATAPKQRRRWLAPVAVAVCAAAAVLLYVALSPSGPGADRSRAPVNRAAVQAPEGAQFVHNSRPSATGGTDEVVDLEAGRVTVAVEPLATGESFKVVTRDAEIATRGAAFEVEADGSELRELRVHAGHVELRREGRTVILAAGEVWTPVVETRELELPPPAETDEPPAETDDVVETSEAPEPIADQPPPVRQRPAAPPAPAPPVREPAVAVGPPPVTAPTAIERAFDAAWTDLRAGSFAAAAAGFARAVAADPDHALAEDARYWRAIALARGNDRGAAAAMRTFLRRHPSSARAGEVSVMLGWIELRADHRDRAAKLFRRGLRDARDDVRTSAEAGLEALGQR